MNITITKKRMKEIILEEVEKYVAKNKGKDSKQLLEHVARQIIGESKK